MVTVRSIVNKIKTGDFDVVHKEIQAYMKDEIKCSEFCEIFKALYHFINADENSNDKRLNEKSTIALFCVKYGQDRYSTQDLAEHQFFLLLYHVSKFFLKKAFYDNAIISAECMRKFLCNTYVSVVDRDVFIKNLWVSFWNESLQVEKRNEFSTAYRLRCKSIEILALENVSKIHEKVSTTLKRYCHYHEKKNLSDIAEFLRNLWNQIFNENIDCAKCCDLFKLLYVCIEMITRYFDNIDLIHSTFLKWISDLETINFSKDLKKKSIQLCCEIIKLVLQTFTQKQCPPLPKLKLQQFKKFSSQLKSDNIFDVHSISYTLAIFNVLFVSNSLISESHQDLAISKTESSFQFHVSMCLLYLDVSSLFKHLEDLPFSLSSDASILYAMANMALIVVKKETDEKKRRTLILTAQNFIDFAISKLKLKLTESPHQKLHSRSAVAIGNVGLLLYSCELYAESCYFLEASCDFLSQHPPSDFSLEDLERSLWKKKEVLVYAYYLSENYNKALQTVFYILINHKSKLKEGMKLWYKVKKAAERVGDQKLMSRTISDVLLELNAVVSLDIEIDLLCQELKYCKFERGLMEEEIIAVVTKLSSLPCSNATRAGFLVEVLTMPASVQSRISEILKLSVLEICIESVRLLKEHVALNPKDCRAKIALSVAYFWLYHLQVQQLHKFAEEETFKNEELSLEKREEENEDCDIQPAFPLLTVSVEIELLHNLDLALDIWVNISQDSDHDWNELSEEVKTWDLLSIINAVAEIFSTSVHDKKELKCWILLRNISTVVGNKEKEIHSTISLIVFLTRFSYFEVASQLLKQMELFFKSTTGSSFNIQVLMIKYELAKCLFCYHSGKFDEGLSLLRKIIKNSVLEKHFKSTIMLQIEVLIMKIKFLSTPLKAYVDRQNLEYLLQQTAVTSALEGTTLAKGLLKNISEKENVEAFKNDWMTFKAQLLKNVLLLYLRLGELNFQIGDVRFARCYLQESLKLVQANLLTYWSSKILLLLGQIDLSCDKTKDCLVKLNGLKYIMEERSKENTLWLLSKIKEPKTSEEQDSSEEYFLERKESLQLKRNIKQNFIHNAEETASPIQKRKGKSLEFEVKSLLNPKKDEISSYVIKLEIWALYCNHLINDGELSVADSQLNKLLKSCNSLIDLCEISDILDLGNLDTSPEKNHSKKRPVFEVILSVQALCRLSLVNLLQNDFVKSKTEIEKAIDILSQSSKCAKYFYPEFFALLQYNNTLASLKQIMSCGSNLNVEYYFCPSVKSNIFVRKNPKLEKLFVCQTPPRTKQVPDIIVTNHSFNSDLCKTPVKKDVLPVHIAKDLKQIEKNTNMTPLLFSSSDDDLSFSAKLKTENSVFNIPGLKDSSAKSTYKLFKSKNLNVNISSSCDIWKYSVNTTPKKTTCQTSRLNSEACKKKSKNRCMKPNSTSIPSKASLTKAPKKKKSSNTSKIFSGAELVESGFSGLHKGFHSTLKEQSSVEYNRSSAEKEKPPKTSSESEKLTADCDDVFYSNSEIFDSTQSKSHSILNELCHDLSSLDISRNSNEKVIYSIPEESLKEYIDSLESMRSLIQHNTPFPLYSDLSKLLAILKMAKHKEGDKNNSLHEIGYLLSQTVSTTFEQTYLNNILLSKGRVENENDVSCYFRMKDSCLSGQLERYLKAIPKDWTVVQINALPDKDLLPGAHQKLNYSKLIITQYKADSSPLMVCVDSSASGSFTSGLFAEFEDILKQSSLIMKQIDCNRKWWQTRSTLDTRLKNLVNNMENSWIGCWKGLLLGTPINENRRQQLSKSIDVVSRTSKPSNEKLLRVLIDSASFLNREQLSAAICHLWNCTPIDENYSLIFKSVTEEYLSLPSTERHPVILLLDKNVQALPWESIPILNGSSVSRMPSLSVVAAHLKVLRKESIFYKGMDCKNTFYILNPSSDLTTSQETFQENFKAQANWKGIVARVPLSTEYSKAIKDYDLFLYCGHGSGRQYLEKNSPNKLEFNAAMILMGCSSGRLKLPGIRLEAQGFPLMCLMSGSPCIVGNLWDVTDKDIDRFTGRFLELIVDSYGEKDSSVKDINNAVSQARNACKLRYLNGAAPVIYGFPIFAQR